MSFLGETIRVRRHFRSMSLQNVADEAQITKSHVWELERGKACNPTVQTILNLSVALELDPCALAGLAFADLTDVRVRPQLEKGELGPLDR